jgi:hypothetical protein
VRKEVQKNQKKKKKQRIKTTKSSLAEKKNPPCKKRKLAISLSLSLSHAHTDLVGSHCIDPAPFFDEVFPLDIPLKVSELMSMVDAYEYIYVFFTLLI